MSSTGRTVVAWSPPANSVTHASSRQTTVDRTGWGTRGTGASSLVVKLLLDGQQRMSAIQSYIEDEFKVFGYLWSELPPADERRWTMTTMFPCYVLESEDDATLRNYYNLTNFGGTAHKETERA